MEDKTYIFIDEFGTPALNNKDGNTSHFIYVAIAINESEIENARNLLERIQNKYNQGKDIHATGSIGKNETKRINILETLNELKYRIYTLVIDKSKVDGDGLKYKQIFIKFFQKIFIKDIISNIENYQIYFDETGYPKFRDSLMEFINNKVVVPDLFNHSSYEIKNDKDEKLIQIADIIANTCGLIFSDSHKDKNRENFYEKIKSKMQISYFPEIYNYYDILNNNDENYKENKLIIKCVLLSVKKFYENFCSGKYNKIPEQKINIYFGIIEYFVTEFKINKYKIIKTYELKNYTNCNYGVNYNDHDMRKIIQFLRDESILIVSPLNNRGYKIPINENEAKESFNRTISNVEPMLRRVQIMNDKIANFTSNTINILNNENGEFQILRKLVDAIDERISIKKE